MPLWDKLFKKKDEGSAGLKPIVQKSPAPVVAQRVSNAKPVPKPAPPPVPAPKAMAPAPEPQKPERESKKRKKDRMRGTQLRWLEAALRCGCAVGDFLVVEWSHAPPLAHERPV